MEGTLDTTFVDDLTADAQIGPHVRAIGIKGVYFAFRISEEDDIMSRNLNRFGFIDFELFALACDVPAIGIWW